MAKEKTESKLKLIHLVYLLVAAAISVGIVYGAMKNQQQTNTETIEKHEVKIDANTTLLTRIDTRQEVVIKGIEEIKAELRK